MTTDFLSAHNFEFRSTDRPDSQYYTEFEDDDSEVEHTSLNSSNQSVSQAPITSILY